MLHATIALFIALGSQPWMDSEDHRPVAHRIVECRFAEMQYDEEETHAQLKPIPRINQRQVALKEPKRYKKILWEFG